VAPAAASASILARRASAFVGARSSRIATHFDERLVLVQPSLDLAEPHVEGDHEEADGKRQQQQQP
jgi:hypothetical protein